METVLSAVLKDPLESSMEGIEDLATGILRTGKLSVQGEAGGVYIIHTHQSFVPVKVVWQIACYDSFSLGS